MGVFILTVSIESKHAYRCVYLKSEQWQNVRPEALVIAGGKCEICNEESIFNDAHHIWYPSNIYKTNRHHLAILCRICHQFVHIMIPECKTRDEGLGRDYWLRFKNAIVAWRMEKADVFAGLTGISEHTLRTLAFSNIRVANIINRRSGKPLNTSKVDSFTIHIADEIPDDGIRMYRCGTCFTLSEKVTWLLDEIPFAYVKPPDLTVAAHFYSRYRCRGLADLHNNCDFHMVEARHLKEISFHKDDWKQSVIVKSKAVSAYLCSLPNNWPCFIHKDLASTSNETKNHA